MPRKRNHWIAWLLVLVLQMVPMALATEVPEEPQLTEVPMTEPEPEPPAIPGMAAFVLAPEDITCDFPDVPEGRWFYDPIAYASSLGLVNGRANGSFDPEATITLAEGVALSVRVYEKYHGITDPLVREPGTPWYTPYVDRAKGYGLLPEGLEDWTAPLLRQEAAALFYYMLPESELTAINTITVLPDVNADTPYAKEILALYNAGVLTGMDSKGTYQPDRTIKRSEFVKLLYALIVPEARKTLDLPSYPGMDAFALGEQEPVCTFTDVTEADWFYDEVAVQQTLGLINGRKNNTFAPQDTVTLAEAAALAVRVYQKYYGITDGIPERAPGEPWYMPSIRLAMEYQILPPDWTNYDAPLTRNRVAYLMYHTLPEVEFTVINNITALPDMDNTYIGYQEVLGLYNAGILTGSDKAGSFHPTTNITRAEWATLLTRLVVPSYRKTITLDTSIMGMRMVYGTSGAGRELEAYRFGSGKNVMIVGFAIHGYEDNFVKDGQELVDTANSLMTVLRANAAAIQQGDWSVYVLPCMNPDGLLDGTTNNGPGRCTTSYFSGGILSQDHGVDMNRSFPHNFQVQTSARNFTGSEPLACKESRALAAFLRNIKGEGINVCIDTHGWTQQIISTTGTDGLLYQVFHKTFPQNTYTNGTNSAGYLISYAGSLGYDACLFELPGGVYSHNQYLSSGYSAKYISCIMNLLAQYR